MWLLLLMIYSVHWCDCSKTPESRKGSREGLSKRLGSDLQWKPVRGTWRIREDGGSVAGEWILTLGSWETSHAWDLPQERKGRTGVGCENGSQLLWLPIFCPLNLLFHRGFLEYEVSWEVLQWLSGLIHLRPQGRKRTDSLRGSGPGTVQKLLRLPTTSWGRWRSDKMVRSTQLHSKEVKWKRETGVSTSWAWSAAW